MNTLKLNFIENREELSSKNNTISLFEEILDRFGREISEYAKGVFYHSVANTSDERKEETASLYIIIPELGYDYRILSLSEENKDTAIVTLHSLSDKDIEVKKTDLTKAAILEIITEFLSSEKVNNTFRFLIKEATPVRNTAKEEIILKKQSIEKEEDIIRLFNNFEFAFKSTLQKTKTSSLSDVIEILNDVLKLQLRIPADERGLYSFDFQKNIINILFFKEHDTLNPTTNKKNTQPRTINRGMFFGRIHELTKTININKQKFIIYITDEEMQKHLDSNKEEVIDKNGRKENFFHLPLNTTYSIPKSLLKQRNKSFVKEIDGAIEEQENKNHALIEKKIRCIKKENYSNYNFYLRIYEILNN